MVGFRKDLPKLQSKTTFPTDVFPHRLSKTVTLAEILDTAKVGDFDEQHPQTVKNNMEKALFLLHKLTL